jgi:hypothetical protein
MSKLNYFNANSEAKAEYTKQLQLLLTPRIYEGIDAIYNDSMKASSEGGDKMRIFQNFLKSIPKWNQEIINDETARIVEDSKCNYMDKLLNAIFISHTNSLTLKKNKKNNNLNIDVPKLGYFIHKCYIETAREFYKNPYLLDKSNRNPKDRQANLRESLSIVNESINATIRNLLPMENILDIYLQETTEDSDDEEERSFEASTTNVSQQELQSITNELVMNDNTNHQNGGELNHTMEIHSEENTLQEPSIQELVVEENKSDSDEKPIIEENESDSDEEPVVNESENESENGEEENEQEEQNGGDLSQEKNIVINIESQEGEEEEDHDEEDHDEEEEDNNEHEEEDDNEEEDHDDEEDEEKEEVNQSGGNNELEDEILQLQTKLKLLELKKKEKNLKSILKNPHDTQEKIKKKSNNVVVEKKQSPKTSPVNSSNDLLMNKNKVKKEAYVFFEE